MPLPPTYNKPPGSLKPPAILNPPGGSGSRSGILGGLSGASMGNYLDPWYAFKRRVNDQAIGGDDMRVNPGVMGPYMTYTRDYISGKYPGLSEPGLGTISPTSPGNPADHTTSWVNQRPNMPGRGMPRALPDQATLASLSNAGVRMRSFNRMRPMGGGYGADLTNSDPDLLRFALSRMKEMAY